MEPTDDPREESTALKSLLEQSVPSSPIREERIQATLQVARARATTRRRILSTAGATGLALLVAATAWRWSGHRSSDLEFATALSITRGDGNYEKGRVQAAAGRVYREAHQLLLLLHERGAVTPALRQRVTSVLAGARPTPIAYPRGFEAVMVKLRSGQELTSDDQETAIASICGAAMAFRELREHSPVLTPTANNLLQLLDEDLREPEETLTR